MTFTTTTAAKSLLFTAETERHNNIKETVKALEKKIMFLFSSYYLTSKDKLVEMAIANKNSFLTQKQ